jgi:hypothetical protein
MSAHQEAIDAAVRAMQAREREMLRGTSRPGFEAGYFEALLDALPPHVLASLAVECGGLIPAGKTLLHADAEGSEVVPVFRMAEPQP